VQNLTTQINEGRAAGSVRLLSVRQEFPTEWARFTATTPTGTPNTAPLTLTLREEHYPFWATKLGDITLDRLALFATPGTASTVTVYQQQNVPENEGVTLKTDGSYGKLLVGDIPTDDIPATGPFTRWLDDNTMPDLWIALTWSAGA
jgi:hypothetical protein